MNSAKKSIAGKFALGFGALAIVTIAAGAFSIWSAQQLAYQGLRVGGKLAPLGDAAMEIKLTAAQAHLLFEEIMGGDESEDINEVWSLLEETRFYADAILNGGVNDEGVFTPSDSPGVRAKIEQVQVDIERFIELAHSRYATLAADQGVGSDADMAFDALYDALVERIGGLAAAADRAADAEFQARAGEARYRLAHGHLLVAEILGGDAGEDLGEATGSFAVAKKAVLDLGAGAEADAIAADIDKLTALAEARYGAMAGAEGVGSSADEAFDQTYESFLAKADEAEEMIHDDMDAGMARLERAERFAMIVPVLAAVVFLAMVISGYRISYRLVATRLRDLAQAMRHLTGGDTSIELPRWRSADEIGELKASVEAFRQALIERAELEADGEATKSQIEQRNRNATRLTDDLARLLDAASSGDLSQRADVTYGDESLDSLARSVNALMETIGETVEETNRVLAALAKADLTQKIDRDFKGAFGQLRDNANATAAQLAQLVADIRSASSAARSESGTIEQGGRDLSQRAESQAAALQETAATMEEMADSVRGMAGDADSANKMADEATSKALRGKEVVDQAVDAMGRIEQSSEKISDIITVIESIAFQTNLLALNAAVEAARAGDAGKGFAVVASEVRTLAQRSSEAARDIKELIQNSSAGVTEGVGMVRATGQALDEIREAVERVASTISGVAEATAQQMNGVTEINANVGQLDEMTQQNAALSQESASSAQALVAQISRVDELVGAFKLSVAAETKPAPQSVAAPAMAMAANDSWAEF